ncbi:MAG: addiction module protein [Gammaproteobacteria bacterium]
MDVTKLEAEALALPVEARAELAHKLLLSLEDIPDTEFDRIWGEESARRAAEVDAGRVAPVSADHVARKARALL